MEPWKNTKWAPSAPFRTILFAEGVLGLSFPSGYLDKRRPFRFTELAKKTHEHVVGVVGSGLEDIKSITGLEIAFGKRAVLDDGVQAAARKRSQRRRDDDRGEVVSVPNSGWMQ